MTIKPYPNLWTLDSKGKVRFWRMELRQELNLRTGHPNASICTVSGLEDGEEVRSEWRPVWGKNWGKINQTTPVQQAVKEIEAAYKKKRDRKYHDERDKVAGSKFFAPMLAEKWTGWPEGVTAVFTQPKLDGVRCIAKADGLWSRQGKRLSVPHIEAALSETFQRFPSLVLDGELYDHDLREDFNSVISRVRHGDPRLTYYVYDVPSGGTDFCGRLRMLEFEYAGYLGGLLKGVPGVVMTPTTGPLHCIEHLRAAHEENLLRGYEGTMVRVGSGLYEPGKRSKSLLKLKEWQDAEFPVIRLEEGTGNWAGVAKVAIIRMEDGSEGRATIKGSREFCGRLLKGPLPVTATVRFFNRTPDGQLRFPVASALYGPEGRL